MKRRFHHLPTVITFLGFTLLTLTLFVSIAQSFAAGSSEEFCKRKPGGCTCDYTACKTTTPNQTTGCSTYLCSND